MSAPITRPAVTGLGAIQLVNNGNIAIDAALTTQPGSALTLTANGSGDGTGSVTGAGVITGDTGMTVNAGAGINLTGDNAVTGTVALNNTRSTGNATGNVNYVSSTGAMGVIITGSSDNTGVNTFAVTEKGTAGITVGGTGINTTAGNGNVNLQADKMMIGQAINAGIGTVTLANNTLGGVIAINLGSATDAVASTIELSDTELDLITASVIRVGSATAGAINVSAAIDTANTNTLHLITGAGVTQAALSTITEANLAINAGAAVTLTEANAVTNLAISAAGAVQFTDVGGVQLSIDHGLDSSVGGVVQGVLVLAALLANGWIARWDRRAKGEGA